MKDKEIQDIAQIVTVTLITLPIVLTVGTWVTFAIMHVIK